MPTDALTISAIMLCIVGAVCFYLYTRIKQVEKKVSLMEGILFDIKTAAETGFIGFPAPEADDDDDAEAESEAEDEFIPTLIEETLPSVKEETLDAAAEEIRRVEVAAAPLTFDEDEATDLLAETETKSVQVNKLGDEADLESMSVADLASLARSKGITGTSKMRKPQLITAIKGVAEAVEDVEGVNAGSSLIGGSSLMGSPL
jgi:hypothetical protein